MTVIIIISSLIKLSNEEPMIISIILNKTNHQYSDRDALP